MSWLLFVVGSYKVAPRCLLPIGDKCKDDKAARKNAESKPGGKKKPKKRPRLLLADPASHRAGPGDEEAGIMPMSPTAAALHNAAFERAGAVPPWGEGGIPSRAVVAASQVARHEASQGRRLETRGAAYAGTDRWLCCVGCLCLRSLLTSETCSSVTIVQTNRAALPPMSCCYRRRSTFCMSTLQYSLLVRSRDNPNHT